MRFYREQNEIRNIEKFIDTNQQSRKAVKKLVTISVIAAHNLKSKHSDIGGIAPFFYYQFYTEEDKMSATKHGRNPIFRDEQSYEVLFDAKTIEYFERQ